MNSVQMIDPSRLCLLAAFIPKYLCAILTNDYAVVIYFVWWAVGKLIHLLVGPGLG